MVQLLYSPNKRIDKLTFCGIPADPPFLLAESDIFHGDTEMVGDTDHDTPLGGTVQLGHGQGVHLGGGGKLFRLLEMRSAR